MNLNGTSPWVRFLNLIPPVEVSGYSRPSIYNYGYDREMLVDYERIIFAPTTQGWLVGIDIENIYSRRN